MKKITGLDQRLTPMSDEDPGADQMLTRRQVLRLLGNIKAETADNSRRVSRIIAKIRDKNVADLVLENDDINFLQKEFERNGFGLTGWAQGQMLEIIESAEKVETAKA